MNKVVIFSFYKNDGMFQLKSRSTENIAEILDIAVMDSSWFLGTKKS